MAAKGSSCSAAMALSTLLLMIINAVPLMGSPFQVDVPPCLLELEGCVTYLNSTTDEPPLQECCSPVRNVVHNEEPCLCQLLLNDSALFQVLEIDRNLVAGLPQKCGTKFSTSDCSYGQAPPKPSNPPPSPLSSTCTTCFDSPVDAYEGAASGNAASWIGLLGLITVMIFWEI